jgi:capsular polysaccharide biosynthesis protein
MDSIVLFTLLALTSAASQDVDASKKMAQAYAKYVGFDKELDKYQRNIASDETRAQIGKVIVVSQSLIDKRITFRWTFP